MSRRTSRLRSSPRPGARGRGRSSRAPASAASTGCRTRRPRRPCLSLGPRARIGAGAARTPPSSLRRRRARPASAERGRAGGTDGAPDRRRRRATHESSCAGRARGRDGAGGADGSGGGDARRRCRRSALVRGRTRRRSSRRSPWSAGSPRSSSLVLPATRRSPLHYRGGRQRGCGGAPRSAGSAAKARTARPACAGTRPGRRGRRSRAPRGA